MNHHKLTGTWLVAAAVAVVVLGMAYLKESTRTHREIIIKSVIGISAQCNDGMYSTSKRDRGTCSGHGGVREWIIKKGP